MSLEKIINDAWENKDQVSPNSDQSLKDAINQVIADLDSGKSRVAEKIKGDWVTHQYLKKAIMLSFRIYPMENLYRFGAPVGTSVDVEGGSPQQQWIWHTGKDVIVAVKSEHRPFVLSYRPSLLDPSFL